MTSINQVALRRIYNIYEFDKINFWRTKAGAEVDFVVNIKGNIVPIEVKYSNVDSKEVISNLIQDCFVIWQDIDGFVTDKGELKEDSI